jgi:hypothetical protein
MGAATVPQYAAHLGALLEPCHDFILHLDSATTGIYPNLVNLHGKLFNTEVSGFLLLVAAAAREICSARPGMLNYFANLLRRCGQIDLLR